MVSADRSASREALQTQVLAQAQQALRPARHVLPGLSARGDYVEGPYPATLEGAVL